MGSRWTERLSAYRIMWLFVFFDLPVDTKTNRKAASKFRNDLLKDGFSMLQFSIYIRHCPTAESMEVHIKRVKQMMPKYGHISILKITDRQFGNMENLWGRQTTPLSGAPAQLSFF